MANSAQARKRARQNVKRRQLKAKTAEAEAYKKAVPVIDRIADKGVIHKNKAARHKSRLNKAIKALKETA